MPGRLGVLLASAAALAAAGCGSGATVADRSAANLTNGKELFVSGKGDAQPCGSCHTLADAGTQGQIGPDLDDAFGFSREHGFAQDTFFEVTLEQMSVATPPMPQYDEGPQELPLADRIDIAAYVAEVAGRGGGGGEGQEASPEALFASTCGSCHVLERAGTSGTVGPELTGTQLGVEAIAQQIREGGGGMPAFEDELSDEQIQALAEYVAGGS